MRPNKFGQNIFYIMGLEFSVVILDFFLYHLGEIQDECINFQPLLCIVSLSLSYVFIPGLYEHNVHFGK